MQHVSRLQVISLHFKYSNVVDVHNQSRHTDLSFGKKCITEDCYFRIYTTTFDVILTGIWKLFKYRHRRGFHKVSISGFVDILAKELLDQAKEAASFQFTDISNTESVETESEIS